MACIWGLTAELEKLYDPRVYTWFDALVSAKSPPGSSCAFVELDVALVCESDGGYRVASLRRPSAKYVSALYFSVYTLTSIGYGDISAHNPLEYLICTICMLLASFMWAYTIGNFCSIVSTMDKHTIIFRQTMDELNFMMKDRGLPVEMRERVRLYFHQSKDTQRVLCYHDLEQQMSTQLRGEVAAVGNREWLCKVWYLKDGVPTEFVREVSQCLSCAVYAPLEIFDRPRTLHIVRRGIAARNGILLCRGMLWGEDFVLSRPLLAAGATAPSCAAAFTYVEVLQLSWADFAAVLPDYPAVQHLVNKARRWYKIKHAVQEWGRKIIADANGGTDLRRSCSFGAKTGRGGAADASPARRTRDDDDDDEAGVLGGADDTALGARLARLEGSVTTALGAMHGKVQRIDAVEAKVDRLLRLLESQHGGGAGSR